MIPYLIPLILILFGVIFYDVQGRTLNRRWLYWSVYVYITLLFGLRYRIGWDTIAYMEYYSTFPSLRQLDLAFTEQYDYMQPGFKLLWACMRTISDEFWVFQIVHCTFVNAVVMWFIKNNTRYWFTNLLLYAICYCMYFNTEIMRESIAICFFLMGYRYLANRKFLQYYFYVACAVMFHVSAYLLVLYPLAIIFNLKFDKRFLIVICILFVVLIIARNNVFTLASAFSSSYGEKMLIYSSDFINGKMNNNWLIQRIIQYVVAPVLFLVVYKIILKREIKYEPMICLYILFGLGVFVFYEICVRFANYPTPLYLVAIGTLIGNGIGRLSRSKFVSYFALSCIVVLYLYGPVTLNIATHGMTPYSWIVNPQKDKLREFFSGVD